MKILKALLCSMVLIGLLAGCTNKEKEKPQNEEDPLVNAEQKLFTFKDVGKNETYQGISDQGIDYMFPLLSDKWNEWIVSEDDCRVSTNSVDSSKVMLLRNTTVKEVTSDDYLKKLDGRDIRGYLEQQLATYVGKTDESSGELNYIEENENMKFYDVSGRVVHDGKDYLYRATYFQSRLFQPSVFRKYVPSVFLVLYEDGKNTLEATGMVETFKNNLIYQN